MSQSFASTRLHGIAARLKAEGQRGLQLEMARTMRAAAQPLVTAVRSEATARLPKSGGLNLQQANQAIRVSVTTGARTAGVRIRTRTRGSMQTDKGYVRHPVFGRRENPQDWQTEQLPAARGWWSDTLATRSAAITPLIIAEMNRVGRIIQGGY